MRITCPNCCESYPIDAGFADADGKRLAALFADMEPVLGRAVISYLRLFKPPKSALRGMRAIRIVEELLVLVRAGTVCRDERMGLRRPAPAAIWAAGIEQMLSASERLDLPLDGHNYLRKVVYALAEAAGASAEQQREKDLRAGRREASTSTQVPQESPLQNELAYLSGLLGMGQLTAEEHAAKVAAARIKFGASPS